MAIDVSTIKPGGGGDYTTLAAWWSAVAAGSDIPQAECYTGGDLGAVSADGASIGFTASSSEPFAIYAADGEQHALRTGTGCYSSGAISAWNMDYVEITGLRSTYTASSSAFNVSNCNYGILDSLFHQLTDPTVYLWGMSFSVGSDQGGAVPVAIVGCKVINCVSVSMSYRQEVFFIPTGVGINLNSRAGAYTSDLDCDVYNCTIIGRSWGITARGHNYSKTSGVASVNGTWSNNISANNCEADYYESLNNGTITASHNLDSDNTASTGMGDSDSQANKAGNAQVKNPTSCAHLKYGADAIENGTPVGDVTVDAIGNARDGTSPDIGAHEFQGVKAQVNEGVTINEGVELA